MTIETVGRNEDCPCDSGKKFNQCCEAKSAGAPSSPRASPKALIALALVLTGLVAFVLWTWFRPVEEPVATTTLPPVASAPVTAGEAAPLGAPISLTPMPEAAATPGMPQPEGPAPDGKVWSVEHGHWHDDPGALGNPPVSLVPQDGLTATATPTIAPMTPGPQPDGPVPEGKVWSVEHGHWHDAPGAMGQTMTLPSPGPGLTATATPSITPMPMTPAAQPPGPVPEGKVWSVEHGHWHDAPPATP